MIRLFRVSIPASVFLLVGLDTILISALYALGTYFGYENAPEFYLFYDGGWWRILIVVGIVQIGLYFEDLYEKTGSFGRLAVLQQLSLVLGVAFLIQAVFGYGHWTVQLHKWVMVYGSLLTLFIFPVWRSAFSFVVTKALPGERVAFLGRSGVAKKIAHRLLDRPEFGLVVIGYIDDEPEASDEEPFPGQRLGSAENLKSIVEQMNLHRIIVGVGNVERSTTLPIDQLLDLRFAGIHVEEAAVLYETVFGRISMTDLRPTQLIFSSDMGPRPRNQQVQNVYSFILGVVGILISLPIMAVVAILVKLTSPGPILYRQTRVGFKGVTFQVFKFRSMHVDAEARTGAVWASQGDPRITPVGRWIRKLRLDELPQFFNVVQGEMAVAGPRPERPEFCKILEDKIPYYKHRHSVKPGITGWAQINHDYSDTIEDSATKLEYDLFYIKNLAPSLDAYIIFHTLKVMLLSRGSR